MQPAHTAGGSARAGSAACPSQRSVVLFQRCAKGGVMLCQHEYKRGRKAIGGERQRVSRLPACLRAKCAAAMVPCAWRTPPKEEAGVRAKKGGAAANPGFCGPPCRPLYALLAGQAGQAGSPIGVHDNKMVRDAAGRCGGGCRHRLKQAQRQRPRQQQHASRQRRGWVQIHYRGCR